MRLSRPALAACISVAMQTAAAQGPSFEVASIKAPVMRAGGSNALFLGHSGGPGTPDPSRFEWPNGTLRAFLLFAYDLKPYQLVGPDWMDAQHYELEARIAAGAPPADVPLMMQKFLAERFHLTIHHETKEVATYSLVVAKSGSKLKQASETPAAAAPVRGGVRKPDAYGFMSVPPLKPGMSMASVMPGRERMISAAVPLSDFANRLSIRLGRPVTDATGLTGKYDIVLTYSSEGLPNGGMPSSQADVAGEPVPDLFAALQSQLGLRLQASKGRAQVIVVDRADRIPTAN